MNRPSSGFTLVELAVVVFLLSVTFLILLPRLPDLSESRKNAAFRRLTACIQANFEDALFKKKAWRSSTA
ncbi:MAG: hypothetical protein Kow0092_32950 [Deferrisomatales bacterium]